MLTDTTALPLFPGVEWSREDYAELRLRLDIYTDFITATNFDGFGGVVTSYLVDPEDVAASLAGRPIATGLLPPGCLWWQKIGAQERLAIYAGPQVWPVSVVGLGRLTVPMPGLIWLGRGREYRLYAVAEEPLTAKTELYHVPCPNVSGSVCAGNVPFPAASRETIWAALRLFFESEFNTHLDNGKSVRLGKGSILPLWQELSAAGAEVYPLDDLVRARLCLGDLMERE
jgi:hypothetical protein